MWLSEYPPHTERRSVARTPASSETSTLGLKESQALRAKLAARRKQLDNQHGESTGFSTSISGMVNRLLTNHDSETSEKRESSKRRSYIIQGSVRYYTKDTHWNTISVDAPDQIPMVVEIYRVTPDDTELYRKFPPQKGYTTMVATFKDTKTGQKIGMGYGWFRIETVTIDKEKRQRIIIPHAQVIENSDDGRGWSIYRINPDERKYICKASIISK